MLLADSAEAIEGKLYILGGGRSVIGPDPTPSVMAIKIEVPWDQANMKHELELTLLDQDGRPAVVFGPRGASPVVLKREFEVGRPAGHKPGTPLDVALTIEIDSIYLHPHRYVWSCSIDGRTQDDWRVAFTAQSYR